MVQLSLDIEGSGLDILLHNQDLSSLAQNSKVGKLNDSVLTRFLILR